MADTRSQLLGTNFTRNFYPLVRNRPIVDDDAWAERNSSAACTHHRHVIYTVSRVLHLDIRRGKSREKKRARKKRVRRSVERKEKSPWGRRSVWNKARNLKPPGISGIVQLSRLPTNPCTFPRLTLSLPTPACATQSATPFSAAPSPPSFSSLLSPCPLVSPCSSPTSPPVSPFPFDRPPV